MPNTTVDYCGNLVYNGPVLSRILLGGEGYCQLVNGSPSYYFFIKDHLGSTRAVVRQDGGTIQSNQYYPFGGIMAESSGQSVQPWKYSGKELDRTHGLDAYDFGARTYFADRMQWGQMDPLCEIYYDVSPYMYCMDNPIKYIDPDGLSTWVTDEGDGKYKVIGSDLCDNDLNIYVYSLDKKGEYTISGKSIGETPLHSSFYDSDRGVWAEESIIDINDMSGINFIQKVKGNNVPLLFYIANAFNDHKFDFKATNGTNEKIYSEVKDYYRGMPIKLENGKTVITSARDIGNMMAGYKAGISGLDWSDVEKAFDLYQLMSPNSTKEGFSSRNAQKYGFMIGRHKLPYHGKDKIFKIITLIGSLI